MWAWAWEETAELEPRGRKGTASTGRRLGRQWEECVGGGRRRQREEKVRSTGEGGSVEWAGGWRRLLVTEQEAVDQGRRGPL